MGTNKKIILIIALFFVLIISSYILYLSPFLFWERVEKEVDRIVSPDGRVEAVVIESDAGATTSLSTIVYIVPSGRKITDKDKKERRFLPVFDADHIQGKKIYWLDNKILEIQYQTARITHFRNYSHPLKVANYVVEVREKPLSVPTLPLRDQ